MTPPLEAWANYYVIVAVGKQTALHLAAALGAQGTGGPGALEIVRSTGERDTAQLGYVGAAPGAATAARGS